MHVVTGYARSIYHAVLLHPCKAQLDEEDLGDWADADLNFAVSLQQLCYQISAQTKPLALLLDRYNAKFCNITASVDCEECAAKHLLTLVYNK